MEYPKCSTQDCSKTILLRDAYCIYCKNSFCYDHIENSTSHPCFPTPPEQVYITAETQIRRTTDHLSLPTVVTEAEALRPGHTCQAPQTLIGTGLNANIIRHGTNIHFPLEWDDGQKWMVRVRQNFEGAESGLAIEIAMMNEAATFTALHNHGLPVPRVWRRDPSRDYSKDAVHYYFVEFVHGAYHHDFDTYAPPPLTDVTRQLMLNISQFHIDLETVTFETVGGLHFDQAGETVVGPIITPRQSSSQPPHHLGPFESAQHRYLAYFDNVLDKILAHAWCPPSRAKREFLTALEGRKLVKECEEMAIGPWYIKHGEPKGDHILATPEGKIAGVIDRELSFITSRGDAFAAPTTFALDPYFEQWSNALSWREEDLCRAYEQLGKPGMAQLVREGKKYQRLNDVVCQGQTFWKGVDAMRRAFKGLPDDTAARSAQEWEAMVLERHKDDERLPRYLATSQA